MILKNFIFVINFSFLCLAKKLLIETRQISGEKQSKRISNASHYDDMDEENYVDDTSNDYMFDVEIKSVDAGNPVQLKCESPTEFSKCSFTKVDELISYEIRPKVSFQNQRLQCLCDVSLAYFMVFRV